MRYYPVPYFPPCGDIYPSFPSVPSTIVPVPVPTTENTATSFDQNIYSDVSDKFLYRHPILQDPTCKTNKNVSIPELSTFSSRRHTVTELFNWSKTLPKRIQNTLSNSTGKHNPRLLWSGEIVFRHCLPAVLLNCYLTQEELENLSATTSLVGTFFEILRKYGDVDTTKIQGYDMYKNFRNETEFDEERIRLSTAALLHCVFLYHRWFVI